jgi:predicted DNA-binding transcriptional regulator AlpA
MTLLDYKPLKDKGITYSREHIARKVKAGEFPEPVVLSRDDRGTPKRIAWVEAEVDAWIADLAAKRETTKVAA